MLTSLLGLGGAATCCSSKVGHDPGKYVRPIGIERVGLCGAPLQGSLSIRIAVSLGKRTTRSCTLTL